MSEFRSPGVASQQRILSIRQGTTEVDIPVPLELWSTAEHLRQSRLSAAPSGTEETPFEVTGKFLEFVLSYRSEDANLALLPILKVVFIYFRERFLSGNDIHAVVREMDAQQQTFFIQTYLSAFAKLKAHNLIFTEECPASRPALLTAAKKKKASLLTIFGGQGNVDDYFSELAKLFSIYGNFIAPSRFVERVSTMLLQQTNTAEAKTLGFYSKGFDVLKWLNYPDTVPPTDYLLSTPISMPLIGFTQLLNYLIMLKVLNRSPHEVRSMMRGTTGHSQGLISAVVISSSGDEEDFLENSEKALRLLFWMGLRSQEVFPTTTLNPKVLQDSLQHQEGDPTPMLAINNLPLSVVTEHVEATNQHLPEDRKIVLSLINGPRSIIVSGAPQSLYGLNVALRHLKAKSEGDQSRIPHSKRNVKFSTRFLPVSAPFHSSYLEGVPKILEKDIEALDLVFRSEDLAIPVFATDDGRDLKQAKSSNFTMELVTQILASRVEWEKATKTKVTHIIDFGPGGISGIGALTFRNKEGTGVQIILGGGNAEVVTRGILDKSYLFDSQDSAVQFAQDWSSEFAPKLVQTTYDGKIHVDTRYTRLMGKPPLMVAGMTPTTVNETFVSACINAGFHCELAGGGHYNEAAFRSRIEKIMERISPGESITVNILFLNARQWGFQYPLVQAMRREGYPIEGICIAAGVPSLENANEIIAKLQEAGLRHVAFKPGSIDSIRQVIAIAEANPTMPILLQWTGGRAGGHHSFEDFHQPILRTYAEIRRQPNIVLVGGSGMGDAKGSLPYLTGDWSLAFDYPPMPFDAILFGSRMMIAKESLASTSVKQVIVDAPGIQDEKRWEESYAKPTGGIVTVKSELGEPIHKIATRGVLLWKELDETVFSLPKDKRVQVLKTKKNDIIARLNADSHKVWFGKKADGKVCDLHEMTYAEVAHRMVEVMFVHDQIRWIHPSYRKLVVDYLTRVEERFSKKEKDSLLQNIGQGSPLDTKPVETLSQFFAAYPEAVTQILQTEDSLHFLTLCRRRGQKPVPFVPVLDHDLEFWFKKDSLWQSEDVDAVVDKDPQRVCILQGPVAASYSKIVNEPINDILSNIYGEFVTTLRDRYYGDHEETIQKVDYLGGQDTARSIELPKGIKLLKELSDPKTITYEVSSERSQLPDSETWLQLLSGASNSWLRALLSTGFVVQGKMLTNSPIRALFKPRLGQRAQIKIASDGQVAALVIYDQLVMGAIDVPALEAKVVEADKNRSVKKIEVNIIERKGDHYIPLPLLFEYRPAQGYAPIHEIMEGRNKRIKKFYWDLWFGEESYLSQGEGDLSLPENLQFTSRYQIKKQEISEFCRTVGNQAELYIHSHDGKLKAPMDFAIVIGWKAVIKSLFPDCIDADLLKLVHLSNEFSMIERRLFQEDDVVDCTSEIHSITNDDNGKTVEVKGTLSCEGREVMHVTSRFFFRGNFTNDFGFTFRKKQEVPMEATLKDSKDVAVIKSKHWINWNPDFASLIEPGVVLTFRLETFERYKNKKVFSELSTTGTISVETSTKETIQIGAVDFTAGECHGNPVMEYLNRVGRPVEQAVLFESGGYSVLPDPTVFSSTVSTPSSNVTYARVSHDLNPIHVNPYFADFAELPDTITHGMWTSAATRKFVEIFAADNRPERVTSYTANFVDMVLPGDTLQTRLSHIGMRNGKKIIKVETVNQHGIKVIEGSAEVDQPITAYVFTGQGSQEKGMGMDLYQASPIARQIWDRADAHFRENYGFSILDIVKNNPKERIVHFGGPKGDKIRRNYMGMTYDVVRDDGALESKPLFPDIKETTPFHKFSSPTGLLNATQFTQPALTLLQKAAYEDMRSRGLIQQDCAFAGHSLGEYAALASIGNVLPIESLVDVVFYRGMTMQAAVPRDAQSRSDYGMVAVNPSRVGKGFGELPLKFVVDCVCKTSGRLLEIVNYNVENWQYVVSGELTNLEALTLVLSYLYQEKINVAKLIESTPLEEVTKQLEAIVVQCLNRAREKKEKSRGFLELDRGIATIPLNGIDVPFHSRFLLSGVGPFREYLSKRINPNNIDVTLLSHKYIPNLVASPFQLTLGYLQKIYDVSGSPKISKIIKTWGEDKYSTAAQLQRLGYVVLIELLAYQFASPVRWIETQDVLFRDFRVERMVEIGPGSTLCGMAARTLKFKYEAYDEAMTYRRENLSSNKDKAAIYYEISGEAESSGGDAAPAAPSSAPSSAPAAPAPVSVPPPVAAAPAASSGAQVPEAPISAELLVHVILAQKLKKGLGEVPMTKSIKDLSAGKSTLQNEILGDLQKELGKLEVEKPEELPLKELAQAISSGFPGTMGKHTSALLSKMMSGKMPGGFGLAQAKSYLSEYRLGANRASGVLLLGLTLEPSTRLGSESDAKSWLDKVVSAYSAHTGVAISKDGGAPAAATPAAFMAAAPAAAAQQIPDAPVRALEFLKVLIAAKLKKKVQDVPESKPIKDMVGGKSTLQNELLGDIQKEFGQGGPDNGAEIPLTELAQGFDASYKQLGKTSNALITRMLGAKMPGGFGTSSVKAYLGTRGFGPLRQEGILLHTLTLEPAARLGAEADAKAFLDSAIADYCSANGVSASAPPQGGAAVAVGGMVNSAEMMKFQLRQDNFIREQLELFASYLGFDLRDGYKQYEQAVDIANKNQAEIDLWRSEHGEFYAEGIVPHFDVKKVRLYDSSWNWARQEAIQLYYDIIFGRLTEVDREVTQKCIFLMNRSENSLLDMFEYYMKRCSSRRDQATYNLCYELGTVLANNCKETLNAAPYFKDVSVPTGPLTTITPEGDIKYREVPRSGIRKLESYVKEMKQGSQVAVASDIDIVRKDLVKLHKMLLNHRLDSKNKVKMQRLVSDIGRTLNTRPIVPGKATGQRRSRKSSLRSKAEGAASSAQGAPQEKAMPFLHLKRSSIREPGGWEYCKSRTNLYFEALSQIASSGITFQDKVALVTGCGRDSIGAEILKGLLAGGAKVIATTSSFSKKTTEFFREVYEHFGSKGSSLVVVPFNQGSLKDLNALVDYIYNQDTGLGWDLDFILPFAAVSENGRELSDLDSRSEFSHRVMLTNLLRLLGAVKAKKQELGHDTRPAEVVLPLSPNHGIFGGDGLYAESKIGLETLFNKWHSESWGAYLTVVGAVIGWTRGTGLMLANNMVAEELEKLGVRTFSTQEMAFNILGLMHPSIVQLSQGEPVWADLNGGLQLVADLNSIMKGIRSSITETAQIRKAVAQENARDESVMRGPKVGGTRKILPRSNIVYPFPKLKEFEELQALPSVREILDLDRVVVVTGFGEVGPWGNSRTRWEMEASGEFSLEGCIEMAWIMGYIKHFNGQAKDGSIYSGWVDAQTLEPVKDFDVKTRYEEKILKHSGIRLIEPSLFDGYDPNAKNFLQQVAIDHDLSPIEVSKEEALAYKRQQGDFVEIYEKGDDLWVVRLKKGANLYIPKALRFDRLVAGQIPTGWDPKRYGIPEDIVNQVDPVTLYVLVSTVEALVASGVTDPYEFYQYVHVSEVGNTSGGGVGGMKASQRMYRDRFIDKPVQSDILQENFINTMPAWVNMLLLSSSGPIKTPVGACATAVESIDIGVETILSGKAKIVIAGGYDDFQEEGSYEFANMKATSNAVEELAKGRDPREMSRPTTTTRSGFMEAHGAGMQILMPASLAIQMGVPIYGIVALSNTATDKEGRSVPAPGQGILTTARELAPASPLPILSLDYRKRQMALLRKKLSSWVEHEYDHLREELELMRQGGLPVDDELFQTRVAEIEREAKRQEKAGLALWGNEFYKNHPNIAGIRGALAVFGLEIDDIQVASFHGTSTIANDINESHVLNMQMQHLGRSKGNILPSVMQKYLTGHPKGAAAAWMLNGILQSLDSGIIPGNRNADNIDEKLKEFEYVFYPSRSIQTDGIKAGILKSFGFGQVGGEVLVIHPDYVLATLDREEYARYRLKRNKRQENAYRYLHDSLAGVSQFVQVKNAPPYKEEQMHSVYLNPTARAMFDEKNKTWGFSDRKANGQALPTSKESLLLAKDLMKLSSEGSIPADERGVGVDIELLSAIDITNETFLERNFTEAEQRYCLSTPDPRASFTGRWSAKEAVIKAISNSSAPDAKPLWKGAGAGLKDIEILPSGNGSPKVVFHNEAQEIVSKAGVKNVKVSISHSGAYAMALAYAQ